MLKNINLFNIVDISTIFTSNIREMETIIATKTIFYTIERTIKEYRKFAQNNISSKALDITVDQALILFFLSAFFKLTSRGIPSVVKILFVSELINKKGGYKITALKL